MKLLGLEYFKIRRKKIWIMIILFLTIEMLWALMSTSMSNANHSNQAVWGSIIFNVSSMNGLFMPILSAIVVSRICDMEHKGETWKLLVATNVSRKQIYMTKYICANGLLLFCIFGQTILMSLFGLIKEFPGAFPIELFIQFIVGTLLTTLAVTALQQWISLAVKNQSFALVLGMLGGFIGMTAGLFPATFRHIFIWSYYLDLSPFTFNFSETSSIYMAQPVNLVLVFNVLAMAIIFYIAGNTHVSRQEI